MNSSVYTISTANFGQEDGLSIVLAKAKKGDSKAFAEIYNWYFKKIYKFIYFRVGHKETAEDLAEEVFLKAYTKLNSLNDGASFEGWLYQIARNLVIDYYRQKKVTIDLQEVENSLLYEDNILDRLSLEENQKILLKHIKELNQEQQLVIKLKFLENLKTEEIAELLNKKAGAVRVIQHRAVSKLKDLILKNEILD